MSTDLIEFLRARIAEDEAVARGAFGDDLGGGWRARDDSGYLDDLDGAQITDGLQPDEAQHIAHWDPARVLAECEAKKRLLEQFRLRGDSVRATVRPTTGGVWDDLLRLLALPYAEHEDYREEWRP